MRILKEQKGITIIALIITVIIMLILTTIVVRYSVEAINRAKLEDLKTNMLLIQGKSKTIYEKYSFKEIEELTGLKYSPQETALISYVISDGLQQELDKNDVDLYYIWEQEDLVNNGLGTITSNQKEFFMVDYLTGEVYYSLGYTKDGVTYYSLTSLQNL